METYLEGNQSLTVQSVEDLRQILRRQQHRDIDFAEAREVAESLLSFYSLLDEQDYDEQIRE